jgi:ribose transport system ATP-binding protein
VRLQVEKITKSFPGTLALRDVDLAVEAAQVHGIVGENGAGKSTLVRIISGEIGASSGSILIDGVRSSFRSPVDALRSGIALVSQEGNLIPYFTGAENIALGSETRIAGILLDHRKMLQEARQLAQRYFPGFDLQLNVLVSELPPEDRKVVEILRALRRTARVLILDEPTATLQAGAKERLFEVIAQLKQQGLSVILISHFLHEILQHSDQITVLRDGAVVHSGATDRMNEAELIRRMIGSPRDLWQQLRTTAAPGPTEATARPRLETRALSGAGFHDVSLQVGPGEIVGLVGLTGAGHRQFAEALYGAERVTHGTVLLDGKEIRVRSTTHAREAGIALIPDSRMTKALFPEWTLKENLSAVHLADVAFGGTVIRRRREIATARTIMRELDIRAAGEDQGIEELSGGNKQKASIGRWLFSDRRRSEYKLCIIIEPTEGVDVGAKTEIHKLIAGLAEGDTAVLLISSDFAEVEALTDRLYVFRAGTVVSSFSHEAFSEEAIANAMAKADDQRDHG